MRENFQKKEGDIKVGMMLRMLNWRNEGTIWSQKMESTQSVQK